MWSENELAKFTQGTWVLFNVYWLDLPNKTRVTSANLQWSINKNRISLNVIMVIESTCLLIPQFIFSQFMFTIECGVADKIWRRTSKVSLKHACFRCLFFQSSRDRLHSHASNISVWLRKKWTGTTPPAGWGEPTRTLVPWRQGFRHPTRNECMGWFAQITTHVALHCEGRELMPGWLASAAKSAYPKCYEKGQSVLGRLPTSTKYVDVIQLLPMSCVTSTNLQWNINRNRTSLRMVMLIGSARHVCRSLNWSTHILPNYVHYWAWSS